jgi:hypothetical protein
MALFELPPAVIKIHITRFSNWKWLSGIRISHGLLIQIVLSLTLGQICMWIFLLAEWNPHNYQIKNFRDVKNTRLPCGSDHILSPLCWQSLSQSPYHWGSQKPPYECPRSEMDSTPLPRWGKTRQHLEPLDISREHKWRHQTNKKQLPNW